MFEKIIIYIILGVVLFIPSCDGFLEYLEKDNFYQTTSIVSNKWYDGEGWPKQPVFTCKFIDKDGDSIQEQLNNSEKYLNVGDTVVISINKSDGEIYQGLQPFKYSIYKAGVFFFFFILCVIWLIYQIIDIRRDNLRNQ